MTGDRTAQALVELRAHDPEAVSAEAVVRHLLKAPGALRRLRRFRVIELRSRTLPERPELEDLLHRSTRFYNPAKERCVVRLLDHEEGPFCSDEHVLLVSDRGDERRAAAERWWRHETRQRVQVREGTAWAIAFAPGVDADAGVRALAVTRSRTEGLFANPHAQDCRRIAGVPPVAWFAARASRRRPARRSA